MRGEHRQKGEWQAFVRGPSPRARGALFQDHVQRPDVGTIPACAGSTSAPSPSTGTPGDHPRVRGEHLDEARPPPGRVGPSPRARGAPTWRYRAEILAGTIPACAGSTDSGRCTRRPDRDHPRVRGEHTWSRHKLGPVLGPSPRARGAPGAAALAAREVGTIPACAGSTRPAITRRRLSRDHPRVRGEHSATALSTGSARGPSPRARGAQVALIGDGVARGTIPACAGSTAPQHRLRRPHRDHPRVRGEHSPSCRARHSRWGPSPRARGARAARRAS